MGTAATPPPEMPRIQQLLRNHISQRPILHLSFFDGIGAASVALQYLGANIVFTLSWETNPQCQALLQHHFQSIQHGDLNEIIRHAAQGTEDLIILITAGPPCVDFSRLRNHPPGMQGEQGNLLSRQTEIILGIKEDWSHLYLIMSLLENVVPHEADHIKARDHTHGDRRQGRWHHLPTETLVVRHRLGQCNTTATLQHTMANHTNIPSDYVAPDQPHCCPTPARRPGQRLGNPNSAPTQPIIPLPHHSG